MKVVIIGSGNVAAVFGRKISNAGHQVVQLLGRNEAAVAELASLLKTDYSTNLVEINISADIYIICVSDKAIAEVADTLKLNNKLVVHTAAAVSKEVLAGSSNRFGVLYPLQSLKSENLRPTGIPILIDGNSEEVIQTLDNFASSWADTVTVANDQQRLKLHLAAVFVNNFTNHLFAQSEQYCLDNKLTFSQLYPIIEETIVRIKGTSPFLLQTGPANRSDMETIQKHQALLQANPDLLNLYNCLTSSIMNFSNRSKV